MNPQTLYLYFHATTDAIMVTAIILWLLALLVNRAVSRAARLVINREAYIRMLNEICRELTKKKQV